MTNALVSLRNTISRQSYEYTPEDAKRLLAHPFFGKVLKEVRTPKPEVLSVTVVEDTAIVEDAPKSKETTFADNGDNHSDKKEANK